MLMSGGAVCVPGATTGGIVLIPDGAMPTGDIVLIPDGAMLMSGGTVCIPERGVARIYERICRFRGPAVPSQ
jgi:hypothetical protein